VGPDEQPRLSLGARGAALLLAISAWPAATGAAPINKPAPSFLLEDLSGRKFASIRLRGSPAVLVVGGTRKAAPPCKQWVLEIIKRHGLKLPVYQVIVVDKAWYIPKKAVIGSVKDFTPSSLHHRVLLEWYRVFADLYDIPRHDDPVLLVMGPDGVLRLQQRGQMTEAGLQQLAAVLRSTSPAAKK
jgi:hypothetical protein